MGEMNGDDGPGRFGYSFDNGLKAVYEKFNSIDLKGNNGAILSTLMLFAGTSLTPVATRVLSFALFTSEGIIITSVAAVSSAIATLIYCYKNEITYEQFKEYLKGLFKKATYMLAAAAVVNKVAENAGAITSVVTNVVEETKKALSDANQNQETKASSVLPSVLGSAAGDGVEAIVKTFFDQDKSLDENLNKDNSKQIGAGTKVVVSALAAQFAGANPMNSVAATQVSDLISGGIGVISGGMIDKKTTAVINMMTTAGGAKVLDKVTAKLPILEASSNYSTAVFVGKGVGEIVDGFLKHYKIENPGQIKDGFSIMMTSAAATGLGANPYGAVFGLTLSEATSSGVQKLAVFAKLPEIIGEIASTLATPVFSIATKTMSEFLQLSSSPLESITYGAGVAAEGFFNSRDAGLCVSALTSFGGAAITGVDPLTLVVGAIFSNVFRAGVKKAAIAAKCEEETAKKISIATSAMALPIVGNMATRVAIEHPTEAMMGVAVLGLYIAYQNNVHGHIADMAVGAATFIADEIKKDFEMKAIDNGFKPYGNDRITGRDLYKHGTPEEAQRILEVKLKALEANKKAMESENRRMEKLFAKSTKQQTPLSNSLLPNYNKCNKPKINYKKPCKMPQMPKFNFSVGK